jgi:septal ring factor EnvC (AmiA/AmiB activator)
MLGGLVPGEIACPSRLQGALAWPVTGRVRVPFGLRKHCALRHLHRAERDRDRGGGGTPVRAVHEGMVVFADMFKGYGLMVILDHGGKHHSLYAHLSEVRVKQGQRLQAGEVLGAVGAGLEGAGLCFEMRFQGRPKTRRNGCAPPTGADRFFPALPLARAPLPRMIPGGA